MIIPPTWELFIHSFKQMTPIQDFWTVNVYDPLDAFLLNYEQQNITMPLVLGEFGYTHSCGRTLHTYTTQTSVMAILHQKNKVSRCQRDRFVAAQCKRGVPTHQGRVDHNGNVKTCNRVFSYAPARSLFFALCPLSSRICTPHNQVKKKGTMSGGYVFEFNDEWWKSGVLKPAESFSIKPP